MSKNLSSVQSKMVLRYIGKTALQLEQLLPKSLKTEEEEKE
jgi:hypothetical protein